MKPSWIALILIVVLIVALVVRHRPRRPETKASRPVPYQPAVQPGTLPDDVRAEIDRLVAEGQKIQAIKVLRTAVPGLSLKDGKDLVDGWAGHHGSALSTVGANPSPTADPTELGFTPEALADVDRYLAEGKPIQAIKVAREQTGWGLREAKEWVDVRAASR
ncbi:hypothetical protein GCM10023221_27490 [Luteimicrobium xylanilyticum]|uniref:Ribosomal protein L7/L12 C-terminal domain-containing protein n=1 Tax=Luteimicrobium xylanilyticum TaxID=1133546 RepID=A0A5P9QAT4_9MICO|nr:hypothetical protein [Luteimicrobium xylanilyticum]QFU98534.1 hypothetical protein KDY119_02050 [Luteimicrobium xylanilyticum]